MKQARLTLRRKAEFDNAFRRGRRKRVGSLIVYAFEYTPPTGRGILFGFQVKRKFGNAVVRNKVRRRLKEAARLIAKGGSGDWDIVVVATKESTSRSYRKIAEDLATALKRVGLEARECSIDCSSS